MTFRLLSQSRAHLCQHRLSMLRKHQMPRSLQLPGVRGCVQILMRRTSSAAFAHHYVRDYINLADQKATLFFTGATALLAFMYNKNVSARWLKPLMQWNILDTIAFVAMAALAVGAFLALLVIIPRTPGSRRGFLFWEAIAEYETGRQYSDDISLLSGPSLMQVKAEHCYDLAVVCQRKYRMLSCALWTGAVGLAGALFVFLFL